MNPSINNGAFYGRKLSIQGVNVNNATDKQLILKEDYNQGNTLYYDTTGNPSVLLGNRLANTTNGIGTTQRGLFVSKSGVDVTQATNNQLVFNSGQDVLKVVLSGSATIVGQSLTAGQTKTTTITHGLTITPASLVYVNAPAIIGLQGGAGITPLPLTYAVNGTVGLTLQSRVDTTNLYLDLINVGAGTIDYSAYTWTFRYYLLLESAG